MRSITRTEQAPFDHFVGASKQCGQNHEPSVKGAELRSVMQMPDAIAALCAQRSAELMLVPKQLMFFAWQWPTKCLTQRDNSGAGEGNRTLDTQLVAGLQNDW